MESIKSLIDIKKLENSILKKTQGATDEQLDKLMLDITKLKNSLIEIFIELKNEKYSYKVLDELIQINKNQINNLHLLLREQNFLIQQVKLDNSENKYLETNIDYDFINSKLKNPPMNEQNITQEIYNLLGINTEEVLCSPLRFTGVSIEKINQIFSNYGVDTNPKF